MADVTTNYKVNVGVDDAKWQAFVKSVADLSAKFGGATKAAIESSQKIVAAATESSAKQTAAAKQVATAVTSAQESIKAATERRIKSEENAEQLKFDQLKEEYKKNSKAIDDLNNAKKNAADKEAKAEIQIEINKAKELQQVYRKELSERPETKKGKASDVGMLGTKRETGGALKGIGEGLGIGAAIEGFKVLTEKSEEYSQAQAKLHAATNLQMKDVEEIGKGYNKTGTEVAGVAAKVAFATGAQGEELKKQTEAVLAYGVASGKSAEMVAKMMNTETGRAKIFADAKRNEAIAQEKANDPAARAAFIQAQLMDTIGKLASKVMAVLAPALNGIMPILDAVGNLIDTAVVPIMQKMEPVITKISDLFAKLAPVIADLISSALEALSPIIDVLTETLGTLIEPIIGIVQTIGSALSPVLKSLAPLIKQLAEIFATQLTYQLQIFLPVIQALLPSVLQLITLGFNVLIPILTAVATVLSGALSIAVKGVSAVLLFLVNNVVKPVVEWFTGRLKPAIEEVVKGVTAAVKAISSAVNAVKGFLGLGGDAKEEVVKGTKEVAEAAQKEAARQAEIAQGNEAKQQRIALAAKLKNGKISAKEEQELREQAQEEGDEAMLKKLDAFDAKKAKQAEAAGKKEKKSKSDQAKEEVDQLLADKKDEIAAMDITDRQAKAMTRAAELDHANKMLAVAEKFYGDESKQYIAAQRKLQQLQIADRKEERADKLADARTTTDNLLAELEVRAIKENMNSKKLEQERYKIELDGLTQQLALVQHGSEEEAKLLQQRNLMIVKHEDTRKKEQIAIQSETNKLILANQKEAITLRVEQLKLLGKDASQAEAELAQKDREAEDERYKEDLAKRKENGEILLDAQGQLNALGQQLEIEHQQKLNAIDQKAYAERLNQSKELTSGITNIALAGETDRLKMTDDFANKQLGIQNLSLLSQQGGLKKFLVQNLAMVAQNQLAQLLTTSTSENAKTAMVTGGTLARGAALVAEGVASAASAAGTWIATAAKAVYNAFEIMPFPLDIIAAAASVAGVVALATQVPKLFKHGDGGVGVSPVTSGGHQFFEAGPEAVLPLSSSRAQGMIQSAFGFENAMKPVVNELNQIRQHVAKPMTVLPLNNAFENARNNYLKSEDRRSI